MRVIRKDFYGLSRDSEIVVVPIFDVHLGAEACDEKRLAGVVKTIAARDNYYWIGGGDYCDFINRKDPRFDVESLASWCRNKPDIVGEQFKRFKEVFRPIAGKCLSLVKGNHEDSILRHYERDIYSDIVTWMKDEAGMKNDAVLGAGVYGWLLLGLYRSKRRQERGTTVKINLHHGFTGGRLAGAKALNLQKWLWTHECDIALQGHSHNSEMQVEQVEGVSDQGEPWSKRRFGIFCGTFLNSVGAGDGTYSEQKGYLPNGIAYWECRLRAYEQDPSKRIEVVAV